jgi:hypothetical protein
MSKKEKEREREEFFIIERKMLSGISSGAFEIIINSFPFTPSVLFLSTIF